MTPSDFQAVQLYPQNLLVARIPNTLEGHRAFVRQFLVPSEKNSQLEAYKRRLKQAQLADPKSDEAPPLAKPNSLAYSHLSSPSIFICGHNSRDSRCGIMGPLLQKEFMDCFHKEIQKPGHQGISGGKKVMTDGQVSSFRMTHPLLGSSVSLISHIGGHAFAGNVVIYLPKYWKSRDRDVQSPLAGKGIWYGRVEPKHIWGIVEETIQKGRLIEELLRGVHSKPRISKGNEQPDKGSRSGTVSGIGELSRSIVRALWKK